MLVKGIRGAIVERAFFILIFTFLAAIGVASYFGIKGSTIVENTITAAIATIVSIILTILILGFPKRGGS